MTSVLLDIWRFPAWNAGQDAQGRMTERFWAEKTLGVATEL